MIEVLAHEWLAPFVTKQKEAAPNPWATRAEILIPDMGETSRTHEYNNGEGQNAHPVLSRSSWTLFATNALLCLPGMRCATGPSKASKGPRPFDIRPGSLAGGHVGPFWWCDNGNSPDRAHDALGVTNRACRVATTTLRSRSAKSRLSA